MTDVIKLGKTAFTWSVVLMTILWSVGAAALVPLVASAEECPVLAAGDLYKGETGSAVYALTADLEGMYFPNSEVYHSWFEDFSGITTLSGECFDNYDQADPPGVNYRSGDMLIKRVESATVYAVLPGNVRAPLASEQVAIDLYGADWASKVRDVHAFHWANYTDGAEISESMPHDGMLVSVDGSSDVYEVVGGEYYMVDGELPATAADSVQTVSQEVFDTVSVNDDSATVTPESVVEDPSQLGSEPSEDAGEEEEAADGTLTVALASDTPAAASYPSTASGLEFLKFKLTAGSDAAVDVTSITLHRTGVGNTTDFQSVYLYDGDERLTSGRTVNSSTNEVEYNSLSIEVPAGSSKTITVVADASQGVGGNHAFEVTEVEVESGSVVLGTVLGNTMSFNSSNAGTILVEKGSNPSNGAVGEQQAEVTSFTLTPSTEDGMLERISLFHAGTVSRTDLSDFRMYAVSQDDDNLVATADGLNDDDLVVFNFDTAYEMEKGTAVKFWVYADISAEARSGSSETIKFYIEHPSDVMMVGDTFGFPMGVDTGTRSYSSSGAAGTFDGDSSASDFTTMSLDGSDVTVSTSGPASQNVAAGNSSADDVVFMNFSVAVTEEVEVKALQIEFHAQGTDLDISQTTVSGDYITDVKVWDTDTNQVLLGPVDISSFVDAGAGANNGVGYNFTDTFTIESSRNLAVTADLKNSSLAAGSQLYVVLGDVADGNTFTATALKGVANNTFLTSIVPSSYTQGANMTLKAPSLAITRGTTPNSDDVVRGNSTIDVANLLFDTTGSGSDVKVTSVKLSGYVDGYSDSVALTKDQTGSTLAITDLVTVVRGYAEQSDGTEVLVGTESFDSSGELTFSSMGWTIPKDSKYSLRIEVDTNAGHTDSVGEANADQFAVDIADVSADVVAEAEGTALTAAQMGTATYDNANGANSTSGPKFTVRSAGTLTIQDGAAIPAQALVASGSADQSYHQFEMFSQYEDLVVKKLRVAASGNAGNFASAKLTYVNTSGETESVSTEVDSSGNADFSGLDIAVDDEGVNVDFSVTFNTVSDGATTGSSPTWSAQTTADTFEASGVGNSNTNLTSYTNSASASPAMYVVKSFPVFANAGSNGSLSDDVNTLYKFTVTPAGEGKVHIKKLKFNVDATDASGSTLNLHSFRLFEGANCDSQVNTAWFTDGVYATTQSGSLLNASAADFGDNSASTAVYMFFEGTTDTSPTDAEDYDGELTVPELGQTYCLKATVANSASSDSIVSSIAIDGQDTGTPARGVPTGDVADLNGVINLNTADADHIWSDNASTTSHEPSVTAGASADFYGGALLPGLQTDSVSISKT